MIDRPSNKTKRKETNGRDDQPSDASRTRYICSESEPEVELTVARRGPGTQALTIAWTSENGTIGEGSYHYQEGTITFEPGQMKTPLMLKASGESERAARTRGQTDSESMCVWANPA